MSAAPPSLPRWLLERYHLGEATPAQRAQVEAALAAEPSLRAELEALAADDAQTLADHPPAAVARAVAERATRRPKAPARWPGLALAAAAAAAALVVVLRPPSPADDVRLKGAAAPTLALFLQGAQGPARLSDGAAVPPHAVVQAAVTLPEPAAYVLLSFDAVGAVTVHSRAAAAVGADAGSEAQPSAFELDDTPGFERFVLVVGPPPLDVAALRAAAVAAAAAPNPRRAPLVLAPRLTQTSLVLERSP